MAKLGKYDRYLCPKCGHRVDYHKNKFDFVDRDHGCTAGHPTKDWEYCPCDNYPLEAVLDIAMGVPPKK